MEEGPSANQVAVVELGGEDLCVGAQQGAVTSSLTLNPSAEDVTATQQTQEEVSLQQSAVIKYRK